MDNITNIVSNYDLHKSEHAHEKVGDEIVKLIERNTLNTYTPGQENRKLDELEYNFKRDFDVCLMEAKSMFDKLVSDSEKYYSSKSSKIIFQSVNEKSKKILEKIETIVNK